MYFYAFLIYVYIYIFNINFKNWKSPVEWFFSKYFELIKIVIKPDIIHNKILKGERQWTRSVVSNLPETATPFEVQQTFRECLKMSIPKMWVYERLPNIFWIHRYTWKASKNPHLQSITYYSKILSIFHKVHTKSCQECTHQPLKSSIRSFLNVSFHNLTIN